MNRLMYNENTLGALAALVRGGRLPHALLVEGAAGTGRTTLALEIARGALCTSEPQNRPCGECRDCVKVERNVHPDILIFSGEGGSRSFHVDTVRTLRQEAHIRAGEGRCKVLILEDVQQMTPQAANALLKVLEEPPTGVLFVLTCDNRSALLETILSRVVILSLHPLPQAQCIEALRLHRPDLEDDMLRTATARTSGSVGRALALLSQNEEPAESHVLTLLSDICLGSELQAMVVLSAYEKDREGMTALLGELAAEVQRLLVASSTTGALEQRLRNRIPPLQLMRILAIIEETLASVSQNGNRLLLAAHLCGNVRMTLSA